MQVTKRTWSSRLGLVLALGGAGLGCSNEGPYALVGAPYCATDGSGMTIDRLPRPARDMSWVAKPWRFSNLSIPGFFKRPTTQIDFAPIHLRVHDCGPVHTRRIVSAGADTSECQELFSGAVKPEADPVAEALGYRGILRFPEIEFECARGHVARSP